MAYYIQLGGIHVKIDLSSEILFKENEIDFEKKINFIFGKNGTGKSTISKLLQEQNISYDLRLFQGFESVIGENNQLNAVILGEENKKINEENDFKNKFKNKFQKKYFYEIIDEYLFLQTFEKVYVVNKYKVLEDKERIFVNKIKKLVIRNKENKIFYDNERYKLVKVDIQKELRKNEEFKKVS